MATTHHYLPKRRLTITVEQQIRVHGVVAYHATGPQFDGLILIEPWVTDDRAIPTAWAINLGEGSRLADRRTGLPVVRASTIYGGAGPVDFADPRWRSRLRLYRRPGSRLNVAKHAAAELYLLDVLAIVGSLHQQLNHPPLMLAAAKATADRRLAICGHDIRHTQALYAETTDRLHQANVLCAALQALSSLPLVPAPASVRWRGCVDPDVYLHADDDGDWLTCPACDQHITRLDGGDRLGSLLGEVTAHRCS